MSTRKQSSIELNKCKYCNCASCEIEDYIKDKIPIKDFNKQCLEENLNRCGTKPAHYIELIKKSNYDAIYEIFSNRMTIIKKYNLIEHIKQKFDEFLNAKIPILDSFVNLIVILYLNQNIQVFPCILEYIKQNDTNIINVLL